MVSFIGLAFGWLLTFLYVVLIYHEGYDINLVSPLYIGIGGLVSAIAFVFLDTTNHYLIANFVKAIGISVFVTGLLYYTTLLI